MRKCSVTNRLKIVPAGREVYEALAHFHYRDRSLGPAVAIYAVINPLCRGDVVGVIVYSMPAPALELRNIATAGRFTGLRDRAMQLQMVNENIRCISRVIIEPRYRSLGLAGWLVRETMPKLDVPIIEAMAVMGRINPFFEKAGMTAYRAAIPARCQRLLAGLNYVGVDEPMLVDSAAVQKKFDELSQGKKGFIDYEFLVFLQVYGKRRNMPPGLERTRYVLSKLTSRPVYYIWFNPEVQNIKRETQNQNAKLKTIRY